MAAYAREVTGEEPCGCKVGGLDLALFRHGKGTVIAMEARCTHRFAPLSLGRIENGDIRCMYHGIKFGHDGVCVPHGDPFYKFHGNFADAGVAFDEDKRMIEAQQKVFDKSRDFISPPLAMTKLRSISESSAEKRLKQHLGLLLF